MKYGIKDFRVSFSESSSRIASRSVNRFVLVSYDDRKVKIFYAELSGVKSAHLISILDSFTTRLYWAHLLANELPSLYSWFCPLFNLEISFSIALCSVVSKGTTIAGYGPDFYLSEYHCAMTILCPYLTLSWVLLGVPWSSLYAVRLSRLKQHSQ